MGIPKGVRLGAAPCEVRRWLDAKDDLLVVLPAGVRPVKAPRFAIAPLERLRREGLPIRFVVLGPIVDPAEGRALDEARAARPWVARIEVAPDEVATVLAQADLVLNTSRSEGYSNALAEALSVGAPVLVADLPANKAAVRDGLTGLLYRAGDERDFEEKARFLLLSPALRATLGAAARADAKKRFDPGREADALIAAYLRARALARPVWRGRALRVF